jgi:hypothetical protein
MLLFEELVNNETLTIVPYSFTILDKASKIASLDTGGLCL